MRAFAALILLFALLPALSQAATVSNAGPMRADLAFSRTLKKGMSGDDVRKLQERLLKIPGIFSGSPSGYFGSETEKAVQALQRQEGIANNGTPGTTGYGAVGRRTLERINVLVANASEGEKSLPDATSTKAGSATSSQSTSAAATSSTATSTTPKAATTTKTGDTTPPIRSNGFPTGQLSPTTDETVVSLTTNEAARCYWSSSPLDSFDEMPTRFAVTGGTAHSLKIRVAYGNSYTYFVKCIDAAGNKNMGPYPIIFAVEYHWSGTEKHAPRVFMTFPTGGEKVVEGFLTLTATASDNSKVASVRFLLDGDDLGVEDAQPPYALTVHLSPGEYTAGAVATDDDGNHATSTSASFSVVAKTPTASTTSAYVPLLSRASQIASPFHPFVSLLSRVWSGTPHTPVYNFIEIKRLMRE